MKIYGMLSNYFLSLTTVIELLVFALLFLIFPNLLLIIFIFFLFGYEGYKIYSLSKAYEVDNNNNMMEQRANQMKAAYYSLSLTRVIDFDLYYVPKIENHDELLVKVRAAALNPVDYKWKYTKIPFYRWYVFPNVGIGKEFSGEVVRVGQRVTKFREGDQVYGFSLMGTFQEYTITKENWICMKPEFISFSQAAALPLAGGTVYQALTWFNRAEEYHSEKELIDKNVLVIGASGGCGHLALQIARYLGAKEVYGVCSRANVELVKNLNCCDEVFAYDDTNNIENMGNILFSSIGKPKIDLILDTVSSFRDGDVGSQYKIFLKGEGEGKYIALASRNIFKFCLGFISSIFNFSMESKNEHIHCLNRDDPRILKSLNNMVNDGKLNPLINTFSFDYDSITNAIKYLQSRRAKGKLVSNIDPVSELV